MNLRLLLDENITARLALRIRSLYRSVESVTEIPSIKGQKDPVVVRYLKQSGRILVTSDKKFNERTYALCTHPGMIVFDFRKDDDELKFAAFEQGR